MPKHKVACTSVTVLLTVLAAFSAAAAEAVDVSNAPEINIPNEDLTSVAVRRYRRDIEKYVTFWANVLEKTTVDSQVLLARQRLLSGYTQYDDVDGLSPQYYGLFADQAAQSLTPRLKDSSVLKQVNTGIALSGMPRISMQDAYEAMIVHKNPAVRFLGWRGYDRIRDTVLAQGRRAADRMFDSALKAAREEDAAEILSALFNAVSVERSMRNAATVSDSVLTAAQEMAFQVLQTAWKAQLKSIATGDTAMAYTAKRGLAALRDIWPTVSEDKEARTKGLQMVIDVTYASAKAHLSAEGTGQVARENTLLLRQGESALQKLSGQNHTMIQDALANPDIEDPVVRAKAVLLAVIEWANKLAGEGVKEPQDPTANDSGE
ncbi:MAG: hypothetical protein ACLFV7_00850 [Phycisphaerae bacterium]